MPRELKETELRAVRPCPRLARGVILGPRRTQHFHEGATVAVTAPGIWAFHGACRGADDPELFFPHGSDTHAVRQALRAKAFCARCPVREECLLYALDTGQSHGVWGGTTAEERRELSRRSGVS